MIAAKKKEFEKDPGLFLETAIKEHVASSPKNRLPSFNNEPIFDAPLVGFADGDDPIFQYYKVVIGEHHFTPRELWARHLQNRGDGSKQPEHLSVISFVTPITKETRLSLAAETRVASLRWNHTRWQGQELVNETASFVASLLEELEYQALVPELDPFYEVTSLASGQRISNWSQRHMAYAAGLGTFSLADTLITPRGMALRCGSVLTDAPIAASPRTYQHHLANCLFYRGGSCRRCIERCPVGAITAQGHDKIKCDEFLKKQKEILKELGREEGYMGKYPGCGFCQVKVPCESMIPPSGSEK